MHQFDHRAISEYGMGGPTVGSIFCDEVLISDCINYPVFFQEQQICVFLLYVLSGIRPLVAFHAPTGEVWTVDPALEYGWLDRAEPNFPKVTLLNRLNEKRHYDVRIKATPAGILRLDLMHTPGCDACRVARLRWSGESCSQCKRYYLGFWRSLFPALALPSSE